MSCPYCINDRNAGKESSTEHTGRSVLDKIPFLRSCDDDDNSDEDDDFQGIATDCIDGPHKNKKSRGKVRSDVNTYTKIVFSGYKNWLNMTGFCCQFEITTTYNNLVA